MKFRRTGRRRSGNILVLAAVMMVLMFAMMAFAVDVGYVALVRTQAQSAADAAALAATGELLAGRPFTSEANAEQTQQLALTVARDYAQHNPIGQSEVNLAVEDVTFGRLDVTAGANAPLTFTDPNTFNATRVLVRRAADTGGEVPTFFARVLGINSYSTQAEATAAFIDNFSGFRSPPPGKGNLMVLPIAMDEQTWNSLFAGGGDDNWTWDEENNQITPGSDGVREGNLFPEETGSPGNLRTVDIGSDDNSTADISRQIREGVSAADLAPLGGKLELGPDGTLQLSGDTGTSAAIKDDLSSLLIGDQPRIIPVYSEVFDLGGNNAQFTIVRFVGVRVMEVDLTGGGKRVMIQPARVKVYGGIPAGDGPLTSSGIYSPVWLVR